MYMVLVSFMISHPTPFYQLFSGGALLEGLSELTGTVSVVGSAIVSQHALLAVRALCVVETN